MKQRNGFVSNSSSSSFLIASKTELTRERIESLIGAREDSPFKDLLKGIINTFYESIGRPLKDIDEYIRESDDEPDYKIKQWFENGFLIYQGRWCTDEGGVEAMLCDATINYTSDDLIIEHDGGF